MIVPSFKTDLETRNINQNLPIAHIQEKNPDNQTQNRMVIAYRGFAWEERDKFRNYAVLEVDGRQKRYLEYDNLRWDIRIIEITSREVVVRYKGKDYHIAINNRLTLQILPYSFPWKLGDFKSKTIKKKRLKRSFFSKTIPNSDKQVIEKSIIIHFTAEKAGIMLRRIYYDSTFRRLGFRYGDIIIGFNGDSVGSIQILNKIIDATESSPSFTVDIVRNRIWNQIDYYLE